MPVTDLVAERASDFELSREWDLVVDDVERRRSLISATVLIVGGRCLSCATTSAGIAGPGQPRRRTGARVRVAAPMALSIAEHLAGWGAAVKVLEPDSVRAELAHLGAELVQRYTPR